MAIADFFRPGERTTLLSAVNTMLSSVGTPGVTALDPSQSDLADQALTVLSEVDLMIQSRGYDANRETSWTLDLDPDGEAEVPSNVLTMDAAYYGKYPLDKRRLTLRGSRLYDKKARSYDLTVPGDPRIDCTLRLDFDTEVPQHVRQLIAIRACQVFQGRQQTSSVIDRVEDRQVAIAEAIFEQAEDQASDHNQLTDSMTLQRVRGGGTVRRSGDVAFGGYPAEGGAAPAAGTAAFDFAEEFNETIEEGEA